MYKGFIIFFLYFYCPDKQTNRRYFLSNRLTELTEVTLEDNNSQLINYATANDGDPLHTGMLFLKAVFRIRIQNQIRIQGVFSGSRGLKKRSKMLNNHDIILLFSDVYNILSFNGLLLMIKTYNNEVI